jgi:hypothetical protein
MFKKVAMSRVYSDRVDEWAKAKEEERINFSTEKIEKFDFQMALLWQLFSKELGMQDSVIKVCEANDTSSDEYNGLVAKIKKLIDLETTLEASKYLKCLHKYFISKDEEKAKREEEDYGDTQEMRDAKNKRVKDETLKKTNKRNAKALELTEKLEKLYFNKLDVIKGKAALASGWSAKEARKDSEYKRPVGNRDEEYRW